MLYIGGEVREVERIVTEVDVLRYVAVDIRLGNIDVRGNVEEKPVCGSTYKLQLFIKGALGQGSIEKFIHLKF